MPRTIPTALLALAALSVLAPRDVAAQPSVTPPTAIPAGLYVRCSIVGPPAHQVAQLRVENHSDRPVEYRVVLEVRGDASRWTSGVMSGGLRAGESRSVAVRNPFSAGRTLTECSVRQDDWSLSQAARRPGIGHVTEDAPGTHPVLQAGVPHEDHSGDGWRFVGGLGLGLVGAVAGLAIGAAALEGADEEVLLLGAYAAGTIGGSLGTALAWNVGDSETSYLATVGGGLLGAVAGAVGVASDSDGGLLLLFFGPPIGGNLAAIASHGHATGPAAPAVGALIHAEDGRISPGIPVVRIARDDELVRASLPILGGRF